MSRAVSLITEGRSMIDEWDLTATNLHRVSKRCYEVAVLPIGAIEAHNRHLPEGQDYRHTTHVARTACKMAWDRCQSVICLPTIPYGVDCNLLAYPLTIHVSQATLDALVRDIIVSLRKHGLHKVLILNGHGGNEFMPLIRQLQTEIDTHVFLCNWWRVGTDKYAEIFENRDDHAGEMETSVAMALYPELIETGVAGDGGVQPFRFEAMRQGWVLTSRDFAKINNHCASGDPSKASAEKGRRYLDLVCGRIADFLVEVAGAQIDGKFPHVP